MNLICFVFFCSFVFSNGDLNKKSTWKAKEYPLSFLETIQSRLIHPWKVHANHDVNHDVNHELAGDFFAPDSFDAREQWPGIILPVYTQQEGCASGSAIAVIQTISDRFGIIHNTQTFFSLQDIMFCDPNSFGCDGDDVNEQWSYVLQTGVALDSCIPYNTSSGTCKTCADGSPINRTQAKAVYSVVGMEQMQSELQTFGPFQVTFEVYEDFISYTSGVYQHIKGFLLGGGTGTVVGWGVSDGVPYWIVQLSWGTDFGMEGFVWILRGSNECAIENDGYAGQF